MVTAWWLSRRLQSARHREGGARGTILIGISAAKTGILAPYDLQSGQLFQMRINQINKAGGVLGKQIKVEWIDTKSDKPTAAANANELISKGAVAIIATCDFDFSFPAINAARAKKVPGIALCASSPKVATPAIVGPYGGSMGLGSDTEGVTMAEWMRAKKPELEARLRLQGQLARVLEGDRRLLQGPLAPARRQGLRRGHLRRRLEPRPELAGHPPARQGEAAATRSSTAPGSPFGSQLIKAIRAAGINTPITTNASVNGVLVKQVAGNVSNFYAVGFACLPTYCAGTQTPLVRTIATAVPGDVPHAARQPLRAPGLRARGRARGGDQEGGLDRRRRRSRRRSSAAA